VWAVEDTSVQVTWGSLPAGTIEAEASVASAVVHHDGGPGALVLGGLAPGRSTEIRIRWDGGEARLPATTLTPPPGELLARIATVSDLHLGASHWGLLRTMGEHQTVGLRTHSVRCASAALVEAQRWGAELVVLKGDVADHQNQEHFRLVAEVLADVPNLPVMVLLGNHDVDRRTSAPLPPDLGRPGAAYVRGVDTLDVGGLRLVGVDTTVPGQGRGSLASVSDLAVEQVASSPGPALVLLHHHLQRHRLPTHWPPGIDGGQAGRFLRRLSRANPDTVITSGHSHRNRARRCGPLLVTEVGSSKDWPGVWAGYAIHEGGIRQVVRRCQAPDAIAWTEYSRAALFGLWDRWAPGPLEQRCLVHHWSGARRPSA
jgi:predicted phosphodiesterase